MWAIYFSLSSQRRIILFYFRVVKVKMRSSTSITNHLTLCSTVFVQIIFLSQSNQFCTWLLPFHSHISIHHSQPSLPHSTTSLHLSHPLHFLFVCLWACMSAGGFHAPLPFQKQTPALPHPSTSDVDTPYWEKQMRRTVFRVKGLKGEREGT